jgi:hypothetical protein
MMQVYENIMYLVSWGYIETAHRGLYTGVLYTDKWHGIEKRRINL